MKRRFQIVLTTKTEQFIDAFALMLNISKFERQIKTFSFTHLNVYWKDQIYIRFLNNLMFFHIFSFS